MIDEECCTCGLNLIKLEKQYRKTCSCKFQTIVGYVLSTWNELAFYSITIDQYKIHYYMKSKITALSYSVGDKKGHIIGDIKKLIYFDFTNPNLVNKIKTLIAFQ